MKRKAIIIIPVLVLIIIGILVAYNVFYKIDVRSFQVVYAGGIFTSPNDKYEVRIQVWKETEESTVGYIMGTLITKVYLSENHTLVSDENSKIIYWEKENMADTTNLNIDVEWIDEKTVRIGDKTLNIPNDVYDYRRK